MSFKTSFSRNSPYVDPGSTSHKLLPTLCAVCNNPLTGYRLDHIAYVYCGHGACEGVNRYTDEDSSFPISGDTLRKAVSKFNNLYI